MNNIGNQKGKIDIICSNVESSSIELIHYHKGNDKEFLGVTFRSGDSYIYNDIPMYEVINMIIASSIGTAFSKAIRTKYSYINVGNVNGESPLKKMGIV
jgi:hypothetical protein